MLGPLPPSPLFIFITTPGVRIRSPLLVMRNETQRRWVICLRLQTSVTQRGLETKTIGLKPHLFLSMTLDCWGPGSVIIVHCFFLIIIIYVLMCVFIFYVCIFTYLFTYFFFFALPWWFSWWSICLQYRRPSFDPWVRKISWRRDWQPTPVFLPGAFHRQRSLAGYCPWDPKSPTGLSD